MGSKTGSGEDVALQTALAKVKGVKKECKVRILFNTGSHKSVLTAEAVDKIGLPVVRRKRLGIQAFGSKEAEVRVREVVDVCLSPLDGRERVTISCYVVDEISSISNVHPEVVRQMYTHLTGIWFSDVCRAEETLAVDILIGSDAIWEFQEGTSIRGGPGEPVAIKTKLGWVLSGPLKITGKEFKSVDNAVVIFLPSVNQSVENRNIEESVNRLWDLETLGIRQDDVHETVKDDIIFTGYRFSVGLPWKTGHNKLPSNYGNCVARLQGQLRKFKKDPIIFEECNKIITEQLENGVIEKVAQLNEAEKVHYLPSQTFVKAEAETTKVRLIFYASCKDRKAGTSLNDCLHVGPSLAPFLFDILLRFRDNRVALVGDIEKGRNEWPKSLVIDESQEVGRERKKVNVLGVVVKEAKDISQGIDIYRYSTFGKLLRVTAYFLRFIRNLKDRKEGKELERGNLGVTEIRLADKYWFQQAQLTLKNDMTLKKIAFQLNIVEMDGVYVCKRRLENVDMPIASKYPIYLPREHRLTELIVIDCHKRSCHCGVKATLAELRSRFGVPQGRQQVKKVLSKYVVCKKLEGRPFKEPPTAPLPEYRVNKTPPFSNIGVDFAGPLYVRQGKDKMTKCCVCLFSCCVTRALHLELVKNLSARTFLELFTTLLRKERDTRIDKFR